VLAARTAGNHAMRNIARRNEVAKRFKHDVKLRLDAECQVKVEEVIRRKFPAHAILGEEDAEDRAKSKGTSEFEWVIDPIDGTVNCSHGLPFWCSSVAVRRGAKFLAGAIYSPALRELYTACVGKPACLNGKPIHVSTIGKLAESIVFTGLDKNIHKNIAPFEIFERIAGNTQKARITGSAALDICRVACGQAEAYFESGIYIWDIAAAGLIVQQAGGRIELLARQDNHRLCFIATNGKVHNAMKKLVRPL